MYTSEEDIPGDVTHVFVRARIILAWTFRDRPNIVEVVCHEDVETIEELAFYKCRSLRRVIIPGVKIVEKQAFDECKALADVESDKLEIIGQWAFGCCQSLRSINLPSARIVKEWAFDTCTALTSVKFGSKLERIEEGGFINCISLERITLPLKNGIITDDNTFTGCVNLDHVVLIGELQKIVAALQREEWRNDMNEEIDSINQILPNTYAGYINYEDDEEDYGEKAQAIRRWIGSVLDKIILYKGEHQHVLEEAENTLQLALPKDILTNNILPFLALPSHTFEGEEI